MKFLNNLSIKKKLIIIILMVVSITVIGGFIVLAILNINDFLKDLKYTSILQTSMVGDYCAPTLIFEDQRSANEILSKFEYNSEILYSIVLDNNGEKFAEYGIADEDDLHPELYDSVFFAEYYNRKLHIRQPIIYQDVTYGSLYVLVSLDLLIQKTEDYLLTLLIILIISIVIAYFLATKLQKSISEPIHNITSIAQTISEDADYSIRIDSNSNDEIGILSLQFNEMIQKIEERETERDNAEHALHESESQLRDIVELEKNKSYELEISNKKLQEAQYATDKMLHDLKSEIKRRTKAEKKLSDHKLHLEETINQRTKLLQAKTEKLTESQNAMLDLIDEKEESRLNIERANKLLMEANKELEAFSYSVSHDLRAPIRAIEGFTKKLLKEIGESSTAEEKRLANIITDNTSKMGQLIDDLLTFSRMNRGELNKLKIDLNTIVEEVWASLLLEYHNNNVKFTINKLPKIGCDSRLIKQVWVNLLSNAVKFSQHKSSPEVSVGYEIIDGEKAFFVKDNGVGFNMKYSDKLFQVFQRLHTDAEFEGTGIGLAIVDRIVKRHGGRVWCNSQEDIETTFYFTLK